MERGKLHIYIKTSPKCTKIHEGANKYDSHLITSKMGLTSAEMTAEKKKKVRVEFTLR